MPLKKQPIGRRSKVGQSVKRKMKATEKDIVRLQQLEAGLVEPAEAESVLAQLEVKIPEERPADKFKELEIIRLRTLLGERDVVIEKLQKRITMLENRLMGVAKEHYSERMLLLTLVTESKVPCEEVKKAPAFLRIKR